MTTLTDTPATHRAFSAAPAPSPLAHASDSPSWPPSWLPDDVVPDLLPGLHLISARVLREAQLCVPLNDGPEYIACDIEVVLELFGIVLPPIVLTVCSGNVLLRKPITQSTWPAFDWVYTCEEPAFFDALRTCCGGFPLSIEDLRESVLALTQWHPLIRAAHRAVGRMIEEILERGMPAMPAVTDRATPTPLLLNRRGRRRREAVGVSGDMPARVSAHASADALAPVPAEEAEKKPAHPSPSAPFVRRRGRRQRASVPPCA